MPAQYTPSENTKGWKLSCHNHCFRYYICWSQVSRKLPDNYAVKQLLQQLVEGVHQLACGHSTDKHCSVDRVPWQGQWLAYGQWTDTIQLIKNPDRIVSWHIDSVLSDLSLIILPALPLTELYNNSSMLPECTGELSVLYSFSLTLDSVRLFWKLSQLRW